MLAGPVRLALAALAALLLLAAPAGAQMTGPLPNDLFALGEGQGDTPDPAPILKPAAPAFAPAPRATCGPGAKPEPDVQGRVPAGSAAGGLWCNLSLIS